VQQGSVETLYQDGNLPEQIAGFTVIAEIFCPSPAKKPYADAFIMPKFSTATGVLSKPYYSLLRHIRQHTSTQTRTAKKHQNYMKNI